MARPKVTGEVKGQLPEWHPGQRLVDSELRQENIICAHRGWWKSAYMVRKMFNHLATYRDVGWYAPTMNTILDNWVQINRAVENIPGHEDWFKKNDLTFTIPGMATCHFYSLEVEGRSRGPSYTLVLGDEAGEWSDTAYASVVSPIAQKVSGQVILCGTPNVANPNNWFKQILSTAQDNLDVMNSWTIPVLGSEMVDEIPVAGISDMTPYCNPYAPYKDEVEMQRKYALYHNKNLWKREYQCAFIADEGGQFAGIEDVTKLKCKKIGDGKYIHPMYEDANLRKYGWYQTGVDVALVRDYTVITVIDRNTNEQVYMHRFCPSSMKEWEQVYRAIIEAQQMFPGPCLVDCTGIGASLETTMPQRGVAITPIHFNQKNKAPMLDHLSSMIAEDNIKLFDLDVIRLELSNMQRKAMESGVVKIAAGAKDQHDDVPCSLSLCIVGVRPIVDVTMVDNATGQEWMAREWVSEISPEIW